MLTKSFVVAAVLAIGLASSVGATTVGLWSTGVCSGLNVNLALCQAGAGSQLNYGVTDNNYVFSGFSATNLTEHAVSTYIPDGTGSEWLTPGSVAAANFATGSYTVTSTFDLTGFNASTLTLFLDIAADNDVVAALNGHTILSCTTGGSSCFTAFTSNHNITAGASGFALAGVNTLTYTVTNETSPSPTALRVQIQGNATLSSVPEPGTWALLGAGLVALGLLRRKLA